MITATFELADFSKPSNEYISYVQEGNIYAEVKLSGENNRYIDFLSIGKVNGGKLGSRQQERARALRDELLQRVTDAVKAAGWTVSNSLGFTSYKRNAVKQDTVTPVPASVVSVPEKAVPVASVTPVDARISQQRGTGNKQQITVGSYTRTVSTKSITFVCTRCGQTVTKQCYPGPKTMYCDPCKKEVEKEQTRLRVKNLRAGRKAASQAG